MGKKSLNSQTQGNKGRSKAAWHILRIAAIALIIAGTAVLAFNALDGIADVEAETAAIQAQIQIQENIRLDIEDEAAFVQSREFIERIARNWFGLVHRDEIIFIMAD